MKRIIAVLVCLVFYTSSIAQIEFRSPQYYFWGKLKFAGKNQSVANVPGAIVEIGDEASTGFLRLPGVVGLESLPATTERLFGYYNQKLYYNDGSNWQSLLTYSDLVNLGFISDSLYINSEFNQGYIILTRKMGIADSLDLNSYFLRRGDSSVYVTMYKLDSVIQANSARFKNNVTLNGPTGIRIGKYTNGQTIPAQGKTLDEFLLDIAVQAVPPTYIAPSAGVSSSPGQGSYEIGTALNITLSASFIQNDAGAATTYTYAKYISAWNNLGSNTDNITSLTQTTYYRVTVGYNQGPCKTDNLGNIDCTGRINAGSTTSGNLTFTPYPKAYLGFTQNSTVTAADVINATTQYLTGGRTGTMTWNTPAGADIWPFYAYPVSLGAIAGATDFFTGASIDISQFFVQQTIVSFTNAQGFTQSYYVYRFTNKQPQNTQIKINIQ